MSNTVYIELRGYKIIKDRSGYYHITYDNCTVGFFHTIKDAEKYLLKMLKERKEI